MNAPGYARGKNIQHIQKTQAHAHTYKCADFVEKHYGWLQKHPNLHFSKCLASIFQLGRHLFSTLINKTGVMSQQPSCQTPFFFFNCVYNCVYRHIWGYGKSSLSTGVSAIDLSGLMTFRAGTTHRRIQNGIPSTVRRFYKYRSRCTSKGNPGKLRAPGCSSVYRQTLKIYPPFSWQTNNAQRADGRSQAQVTQLPLSPPPRSIQVSSHTLSPFPTHSIPACVGETFCPCRAVTCLDSVKFGDRPEAVD